MHFSGLPLADALMRGIADAGFSVCTPIQAEALPLALAGRDVAGQAQTGTGKTAAFLLATFNHLLTHPVSPGRQPVQPRAVILAPTRELAVQIHRDAGVLGRHTPFRLGLVYGGTGYDSQRRELLQGVDVLIGTPGRLIDYFKQHVFDLKAVQVVVLDEADRMFDLGFIRDIRYLLRRMPAPSERLSLLFSATLSYRVVELAYEHMDNPELIRVAPDKKTVDEVTQRVYHPANPEKLPLLVGLLRHMDPVRSLVFTNTKRAAERVAAWLRSNGLAAQALTGDVPQRQRLQVLQQFTEGKLPVLVATDVAARGLHVPDVSHVFNYDLPQDAEDYVHRIGRTARAGNSGDAISFACEDTAYSLVDIERFIGYRIPTERITPALLPTLEAPPHASHSRTARDKRARGQRDGRGAGSSRQTRQQARTRGEHGVRPAGEHIAKPQERQTRAAAHERIAKRHPGSKPAIG